ncbi:hypothetical protein [Roseomonas populi]|uniref:MarR family transcriptional regulator n=1 Tax=Roseomonas populi TaxID=3121582 RepID=A0ABT1WXF6_9PROT|nr:hypothetical protein [Roseomonas pecuniae]MCR0980517.1 hypothetical protein [Roseomonas pecuniae]
MRKDIDEGHAAPTRRNTGRRRKAMTPAGRAALRLLIQLVAARRTEG